MRIAYYISDYGYGHATRSIAIIRDLIQKYNQIEVVVCHSFALELLRSSISDTRVTFRNIRTDIGYILNSQTLELNIHSLRLELEKQQIHWTEDIHQEVVFLKENNINIVISDISAIAFEAAHEVGILSIGISNFTWVDAYDSLLPKTSYKHINEAYKKMSHYIDLEGSFHTNDNYLKDTIPYFSRKIDHGEVSRIRESLLKDKKHIVFYGLGMKINHHHFIDQLNLFNNKNCAIVVSSNVPFKGSNVYHIPSDYTETQNFIAASDFVITKPGWSTVGEAIQGKTRLLLLERESFLEDAHTIQHLQKHGECHVLSLSELIHFNFDNEKSAHLAKEVRIRETNNGLEILTRKLSQLMRIDFLAEE